MLVCIDGFDGLIRVHGGYRRDDDCFKPVMLQHVVVGLVECHARRLEMRLCPFNFPVIRGADGNELCSWRAIEKVQSVSSAHAAKACNPDF